MNGKQLLLSIVIPTYNRKEYLKETLDAFKFQVERNRDMVEMIVCNNASTDETACFIEEYFAENPFFKYKNFTEYVEVGISISRSNESAIGKYILMWGDDDLPAPFLIDSLLECIEKNPNVSLIHYNRLVGKDGNVQWFNQVRIQCNKIACRFITYPSIKDLIETHILDMSFLSSIVFLNQLWKENVNVDCRRHYGYEFLGRILYHMNGRETAYINYPMCIQRKPVTRSWMEDSPKFRFIGIPNLYRDFEKWGLIEDADELWEKQGNSFRDFIVIMSQTSLFKHKYRGLFGEMLKSQKTMTRKVITFFFIYLCPAILYKWIRNILYK